MPIETDLKPGHPLALNYSHTADNFASGRKQNDIICELQNTYRCHTRDAYTSRIWIRQKWIHRNHIRLATPYTWTWAAYRRASWGVAILTHEEADLNILQINTSEHRVAKIARKYRATSAPLIIFVNCSPRKEYKR